MKYVAFTIVLALAGCESETGILIAISGSSLEEIELHVAAVDTEGVAVHRPELSGKRFRVQGRNLRAKPFELLLRESDEAAAKDSASLRVLALGYRTVEGQERLVGFGVTEPSQAFIRGEVVRRPLAIASLGSSVSISQVGQGCFSTRRYDERVQIVEDEDRDCDGVLSSASPPDCRDDNPEVYPGAKEYCDGLDNDCDGSWAKEQLCYLALPDKCVTGRRKCIESEGNSQFAEECQKVGELMPTVYCDVYTGCDHPDPLRCIDSLKEDQLTCTVEVKGGELCPGARLPFEIKAETCRLELFSVEGFKLAFTLPGGTDFREVIEACKVDLVVKGILADQGSVVVGVSGETQRVVKATLTTEEVTEGCSDEPVRCE